MCSFTLAYMCVNAKSLEPAFCGGNDATQINRFIRVIRYRLVDILILRISSISTTSMEYHVGIYQFFFQSMWLFSLLCTIGLRLICCEIGFVFFLLFFMRSCASWKKSVCDVPGSASRWKTRGDRVGEKGIGTDTGPFIQLRITSERGTQWPMISQKIEAEHEHSRHIDNSIDTFSMENSAFQWVLISVNLADPNPSTSCQLLQWASAQLAFPLSEKVRQKKNNNNNHQRLHFPQLLAIDNRLSSWSNQRSACDYTCTVQDDNAHYVDVNTFYLCLLTD